jgi:hypothetical protein
MTTAAIEHASQLGECRGDVTAIQGIGQLPWGDAAALAQERLDLLDPQPGALAEGAHERGDEPD